MLAPVVRGRKGEYEAFLDDLAKQGFARVRVDGEVVELSDRAAVNLARYEQHTIEVVVDRLVRRDDIAPAPHRVDGDGTAAHRRHRRDRGQRARTGSEELITFSSTWRARYCGHVVRRARPAQFLLQLALRRLPGV